MAADIGLTAWRGAGGWSGNGAPHLRVLSRQDCLDLLAKEQLGRVGLSMGALPVILPVNYVLFDQSVLFRTVAGTKLAAATLGSVVAFEVDSYRDDGRAGWSVLVVGRASELTDPAELSRAQALGLRPWATPEAAQHFVVVEMSHMTGRHFDHRGTG